MNIRYFLYGILVVLGLLLFDAWHKEFPAEIVNNQVAVPLVDHSVLKQDRKKLRKISSQKAVKSVQSQLIHVTTDVFDIDIDGNGGKIVRVALLKYPKERSSDEFVVLLNDNPDTFYIASFGLLKSDEDQGNYVQQYLAKQKSYALVGQKPLEVTLRAKSRDGLFLTKTFIFKPNSYEIKVNMRGTNQSQSVWLGHYYMQLSRHGVISTKKRFLRIPSFQGIAFSSPGKPYKKLSFAHLQKESLHENIRGGWLSMLQHYFLGVWVPDPEEAYHYYSRITADGIYTVGMVGKEIEVEPKRSFSFDAKFYCGPKIADQLKKISPHLAMTIDYSSITFFSLLSMLIFNMMKYVHRIVGNWGWAIIGITIFIRLLFYKLSVTSYRSMAGMRKLQPKIKQLKERYGENRQAMSQAVIELYRKEKINPLGGCLPIVIQIPVFLSLYWVLIESVELRQAPFMLWIQDLSAKDPYYILPLLMGLSMFVQQKIGPQPADPKQAKMMMFLPVLMTVLFLNFPAGLILYWVVNNSLSILQQWYITRQFEKGEPRKKATRFERKKSSL